MRSLISYDGVNSPSKFMLESSIDRRLPENAWAFDRYGMVASGAGSTYSAIYGAIGEFFERRHFNNEVISSNSGLLFDLLGAQDSNSFALAFDQTKVIGSNGCVGRQRFRAVKAYKLPTFEETWIPTINVSLNGAGLGTDTMFFPRKDTTGCSAHFDFIKSVHNSVFELFERQYLLAHWLTHGAFSRPLIKSSLRLTGSAKYLLDRLCVIGNVDLFEITPVDEFGSTILCVYQGAEGASVEYCVGLSLSNDTSKAAEKSIHELWQSYVFLNNTRQHSVATSSIEDEYHRYFIECNRCVVAASMSEISCDQISRHTDDNKSEGDLYKDLTTRYRNIFLYVGTSSIFGRTIFFTKVLSPEFFLHINNAKNCNLQNVFSSHWQHLVDPARAAVMVPFP